MLFSLIVFVVLIAVSSANISGQSPNTGTCLCADGSGINVRATACGNGISQVNSGQCFKYKGSKLTCTLNGIKYEFFKIEFQSGDGWIAGSLLVVGNPSQCQSPPNTGDCPRIVTRAQWKARPPKSTTPLRVPVPKVFIHHTESSSCFSQDSCSALVRSFQNYHMDTKGWEDIGYSFLVGEDGNAYEGRGWDTLGAHTLNWNSQAIGISVIGSFMTAPPSEVALNTVKQLIACGVIKGKISSSYTLHGHRDGVCTDCPGNAFYDVIKKWPKFGGKLNGGC